MLSHYIISNVNIYNNAMLFALFIKKTNIKYKSEINNKFTYTFLYLLINTFFNTFIYLFINSNNNN